MSLAIADQQDREFRFRKEDFRYLSSLVKSQAGIVLADHKMNMVYSRLARRLRQLQLSNFEEYCRLLEEDQNGEEMGLFINAITTNLTRFFREPHHFDHLAEQLKDRFQAAPPRTRVRIWSAGCSSGEEPYSIAMTAADCLPRLHSLDFRILATDLDTSMVAHGAKGEYPLRGTDGLSKAQLAKYTLPDRQHEAFTVKSTLRDRITFKQLNLLRGWPMRGKFDAIFCRNVMIYFDGPTKDRLLQRFHEMLVPDGWLYIGHSETILDNPGLWVPMGKTIYRKARV